MLFSMAIIFCVIVAVLSGFVQAVEARWRRQDQHTAEEVLFNMLDAYCLHEGCAVPRPARLASNPVALAPADAPLQPVEAGEPPPPPMRMGYDRESTFALATSLLPPCCGLLPRCRELSMEGVRDCFASTWARLYHAGWLFWLPPPAPPPREESDVVIMVERPDGSAEEMPFISPHQALLEAQFHVLKFQFKRVHKLHAMKSFNFIDYLSKVPDLTDPQRPPRGS